MTTWKTSSVIFPVKAVLLAALKENGYQTAAIIASASYGLRASLNTVKMPNLLLLGTGFRYPTLLLPLVEYINHLYSLPALVSHGKPRATFFGRTLLMIMLLKQMRLKCTLESVTACTRHWTHWNTHTHTHSSPAASVCDEQAERRASLGINMSSVKIYNWQSRLQLKSRRLLLSPLLQLMHVCTTHRQRRGLAHIIYTQHRHIKYTHTMRGGKEGMYHKMQMTSQFNWLWKHIQPTWTSDRETSLWADITFQCFTCLQFIAVFLWMKSEYYLNAAILIMKCASSFYHQGWRVVQQKGLLQRYPLSRGANDIFPDVMSRDATPQSHVTQFYLTLTAWFCGPN